VTSGLALRKQTYQSQEIRSDYQVADMRHGVRTVEGPINGELSPGTWKDFFAAAVRKAFAAVSAITGASITIAGAGPTWTVTRGAGSWIADGIKIGDVVRLTAGSFNAANINKNLLVLAETATVLTVMPLNGVALVAEGPIASSTLSVPGKKTFAPVSGHTDKSFAIEHWHSDVSLSELFLGCKLNQVDVQLPSSGMSTIGLQFMGREIQTAGSQYYVTPTAETSSGVLAAVNGLLALSGAAVALLSGVNFSIRGNLSADSVVGSNIYANIAQGRIMVEGQFTALFQDAAIRDYFINESEVSLHVALATSNLATADFVGFTFPRIKVGGADKDDGEKSLIQTLPFTALFNASGGAATTSEQSSAVIQDSLA